MADCAHDEDVPIVIVEGFLCATSEVVWGDFAKHIDIGISEQRRRSQALDKGHSRRHCSAAGADDNVASAARKIVFAPVGPVSSLHDRACELFYALRGGTVDYGAQHAAAHQHGRFGRHYDQALLPGWGQRHKDSREISSAHFIGHSLGGLTILKLYDLLAHGFFDEAFGRSNEEAAVDPASSAVLSIYTISSPLRGTPLVYTLGLDPALSLPSLRFLSVGDLLAKYVHLVTWAHRVPLLGRLTTAWLPDFFADAWPFAGSVKREADMGMPSRCSTATLRELYGLPSLAAQLRRSVWAEGTDCAPWECTFAQRELLEGSGGIWMGHGGDVREDVDQRNGTGASRVWLRSVAASLSDLDDPNQDGLSAVKAIRALAHGPLGVLSSFLTAFDYIVHPPPPDRVHKTKLERGFAAADSGYASSEDDVVRQAQDKQLVLDFPASATETRDIKDWRLNDGVVPLASQYHPGACRTGHCQHVDIIHAYVSTSPLAWMWRMLRAFSPLSKPHASSGADAQIIGPDMDDSIDSCTASMDAEPHPRPNTWHVTRMGQTSHATLAPLWVGSEQQIGFWQDVGRWLARIELAAHGARGP